MKNTFLTPNWVGLCGVLVAITAVDFLLGPTAEYLNAHALLCATLQGAEQCGAFIYEQSSLARFALPVAWMAFLLEGLAIFAVLSMLFSSLRGERHRSTMGSPGGAP